MKRVGVFRVLALAWLLGAAACDQPTAPELLATIDRVQDALLADTVAERKLEGGFAGSWNLVRLLPNGRVEQNLSADIDGKPHRFKAFVFERVVVRSDPTDGYPCPLTQRSLLAIEGGRQTFLIQGSDFTQPVGMISHNCGRDIYLGQKDAQPFLAVERLGTGPRVFGVSGSARIDDAGSQKPCDFLKLTTNFPHRVECELRFYSVELAVRLGSSRPNSEPIPVASSTLRVFNQVVPGLRLVIHCTSKEDSPVGGCEKIPPRAAR